MEQWKFIEGFENKILVSNEGRVKSLLRDGRILKATKDQKGYLRIKITINGVAKSIKVHREVAKAFIPNTDNLPQVNHKDGNKENNNVTNLEWISNKDNANHAIASGLWDTVIEGANRENEKRKLPVIAQKDGITLRFESVADAERYVGSRHVTDVLKGKRSHAKGWHLTYEKGVML